MKTTRMKFFGDGHVEELITETPAPRREDAAGERVAQIAARLKAATPGPWEIVPVTDEDDDEVLAGVALSYDATGLHAEWVKGNPDAQFIAHSRSDIEYLLAALSTAERERSDLEQDRSDVWRTLGIAQDADADAAIAAIVSLRVPSGGET